MDAAIGRLYGDVMVDPTIAEIGEIRGSRELNPQNTSRVRVQKYGNKTKHTWGEVASMNATIKVEYRRFKRPGWIVARFKQQVVCRSVDSGMAFSDAGDSGSLVVDEEGYAVGLHFCGGYKLSNQLPSDVKHSCFTPIKPILDSFKVDLVLDEE
jgi:hypothetical protein